jgi:hypothetical protein
MGDGWLIDTKRRVFLSVTPRLSGLEQIDDLYKRVHEAWRKKDEENANDYIEQSNSLLERFYLSESWKLFSNSIGRLRANKYKPDVMVENRVFEILTLQGASVFELPFKIDIGSLPSPWKYESLQIPTFWKSGKDIMVPVEGKLRVLRIEEVKP